jgi:hypothetical protein
MKLIMNSLRSRSHSRGLSRKSTNSSILKAPLNVTTPQRWVLFLSSFWFMRFYFLHLNCSCSVFCASDVLHLTTAYENHHHTTVHFLAFFCITDVCFLLCFVFSTSPCCAGIRSRLDEGTLKYTSRCVIHFIFPLYYRSQKYLSIFSGVTCKAFLPSELIYIVHHHF